MGGRRAGLVVVRHGVGHGEDATGDADGDAREDPPAEGFELDLTLQGISDRFERLADIRSTRLAWLAVS